MKRTFVSVATVLGFLIGAHALFYDNLARWLQAKGLSSPLPQVLSLVIIAPGCVVLGMLITWGLSCRRIRMCRKFKEANLEDLDRLMEPLEIFSREYNKRPGLNEQGRKNLRVLWQLISVETRLAHTDPALKKASADCPELAQVGALREIVTQAMQRVKELLGSKMPPSHAILKAEEMTRDILKEHLPHFRKVLQDVP